MFLQETSGNDLLNIGNLITDIVIVILYRIDMDDAQVIAVEKLCEIDTEVLVVRYMKIFD